MKTRRPLLAIDVSTEGDAGVALARALLFEHWRELAGELDSSTAFYNRYFWFVRFATLWQAAHGYDAGIEQQAFQLTDEADFDLDWDLLEELNTRARSVTP